MERIGEFKVVELLAENETTQVYKAISPSNGAVILKKLKDEFITSSRIAGFKHEYDIIRSIDSPYVVSVLDFIANDSLFMLVLEEVKGISLKQYIKNYTPFSDNTGLLNLLKIAKEIVLAVSDIHHNKLLHKDINPSNIIIKSNSGKVKVIDFGLATKLSYEKFESGSDFQLEGTYPYISPEQTGRVNRGIDYRTDFYSLGITLFELFTGEKPFIANTPREWIHCHVAKPPISAKQFNSLIPEQINKIFTKLLSKDAESRYQSSYGILKDIEGCIESLEKHDDIPTFDLGEQDVSQVFHNPEKIYGREKELGQLHIQLDKAKNGVPAGVIVKGYSGIGKSALVGELQKEAISSNGYYLKGKFDQFKKDIPFQGVVQAFSQLVKIILAEPAKELEQWREKIRTTLGINTGLMVDLIPDLKHIVGDFEKPFNLDGAEANKRLMVTFQQFVHLFSQNNHLLILFIDDLQWADHGSIELIKQLQSSNENNNLLIVGAFRDNEVGEGNPVNLLFHKGAQSLDVEVIELAPLREEDIARWIADVFNLEGDELQQLATLTWDKTQGNPLFIMEFLSSLVKNDLLDFDVSKGKWNFHEGEIIKREVSDSVGSYIGVRIKSLPQETLRILEIASCIGLRFTPFLLAKVTGYSRQEVIGLLYPALDQSIIQPLAGSYRFAAYSDEVSIAYRFAHDTVHQQVYGSLLQEQKEKLHIEIGRIFIDDLPQNQENESIYELLRHLNTGKHLLNEDELRMLAKLNLDGLKRATQTGAFKQARTYAEIALLLTDEKVWQYNQELALEIHLESAETYSLCGMYPIMDDLLSKVKNATTDRWKLIKTEEIKIAALVSQNQQKEAIEKTIGLLNQLGVKMPTKVSSAKVLSSMMLTKMRLSRKSVEELNNLPVMENQEICWPCITWQK
jgi:serine/threonine protein kinase